MITETLNRALIEAMRGKIPAGTTLARVLMDMLYIGKEAAYRRLRGEVPFTLAEAAAISRKLGISLDKTAGAAQDGNDLFRPGTAHRTDSVGIYGSILDSCTELFREIAATAGSELGVSSNRLSQTWCLPYGTLARFRLFQWMYQRGDIGSARNFETFSLPEELAGRQKDFVAAAQQIGTVCYVWDQAIFRNLADDIRYFADIRLLGPQSVDMLKEDLFRLLEEAETVAAAGHSAAGNQVRIFISGIQPEATYGYAETHAAQAALIRLYGIVPVISRDPEIFDGIKTWIHSLRKSSTLISESGERQRIRFFDRQRAAVREL